MRPITRAACTIGTAGHIDHGKTSLVRALTGMDTDSLAEEKKRGLSIDLGFAYMDFEAGPGAGPGRTLRSAVVDVPGHERFIRNMLAGATGMDLVVFTVAADDGVMPQSREHLEIVRLLGVEKVIFAVTKRDLVDAARMDEVRGEIDALVDGTSLAGSPVMAVSSVTGEGIEELREAIREAVLAARPGPDSGPLRLAIDRSFSVKGHGTVVTGAVASGRVSVGDDLVLFPLNARVRVRAIQSLYMSVSTAAAGERAALNVTGPSHAAIERGHTLVSAELSDFCDMAAAGAPLHLDCVFELGVGAFTRRGSLKRRGLKVHHLTGDVLADIRFPAGGGPVRPAPGARSTPAPGRLVLKAPLMMLRGDRFILRDPSLNATIGGGVVSIPYLTSGMAPRLSRTVFEPASAAGPDATVEACIRGILGSGATGVERRTIRLMLNLTSDETAGLSGFAPMGDYVVDMDRVASLGKTIISLVSGHHRAHPAEPGIDALSLFAALGGALRVAGAGREAAEGLFMEVLSWLEASGRVCRRDGAVALPEHRPSLGGPDAALEERIMALFKEAFRPPGADEIKAAAGGQGRDAERVLEFLLRSKRLVKLRHGRYLPSEAVDEARRMLVSHVRSNGTINAAEFRDVLGCGRRLAIEILEYFDKVRFTLRKGDLRTLR